MTPSISIQRVHRFAEAVSALADEASRIALADLGVGRSASVAKLAALQAQEAAALLSEIAAREDADLDEAMRAATWAMTSAAIALTQVKGELAGPVLAVVAPVRVLDIQ